MGGTSAIIRRACQLHRVVPAFNIPYLPMVAPIVQALRDRGSFGLIMVARLEWQKFASGSMRAVRDEYMRHGDTRHTRLHLDHMPVIDEDGQRIDFLEEMREALDLGYESVMVDASRLDLADNIAATRAVCELAHGYGVPVEAELGAVMGHEAGPLPPYEELFCSCRGFTDPSEARLFVSETGCDWLSVAVGSIHGAISQACKDRAKPNARLDLAHLARIHAAIDVPLVLHGGTGIDRACILAGIAGGIAKINVATALRQPYERTVGQGGDAQRAVYDAACTVIDHDLACTGSAAALLDICPAERPA